MFSACIARIYPGFIAAFIVSILLFGSLSGGSLSDIPAVKSVTKLFILGLPVVPGAFAGLPHPDLNGSMWTISYEFRCYVLAIGIGALSTLAGRRYCLAIIVGLGILYGFRHAVPDIPHGSPIFGSSSATIRLTFIFLIGSAFYLWRDVIPLTGRGALLALISCTGLLFVPPLAEPAFAIFGGYLIFWFALAVRPTALSRATAQVDPSYGLYLYAWPVQNLLVARIPGISPWAVAVLTLAAAIPLGLLSWYLIERPMLQFRPGPGGARPEPGAIPAAGPALGA